MHSPVHAKAGWFTNHISRDEKGRRHEQAFHHDCDDRRDDFLEIRHARGENVPAASAEELIASVPELAGAADVRVVEHSNVTSDLMETATAFGLRDRLRGILANEETAGAVVTHGTATMEETAYLLDLTLGGMRSPS